MWGVSDSMVLVEREGKKVQNQAIDTVHHDNDRLIAPGAPQPLRKSKPKRRLEHGFD